MMRPRTFATEEAKASADQPTAELSEKEKELSGSVEKLTKEVEDLNEKNKTLDVSLNQTKPFHITYNCLFQDKYKRSLADSENMRKRLTKQIDDAKIFGIQSFCKDLLEVSDILGHATEAVPKDELNDKNPHLKALYEGLTMTKAELEKVFKRHGLEQVNPIDEKFNPNFHEALFQSDIPNKAPNTVVVVSKIGYKLHERVIRPAMVGVSK